MIMRQQVLEKVQESYLAECVTDLAMSVRRETLERIHDELMHQYDMRERLLANGINVFLLSTGKRFDALWEQRRRVRLQAHSYLNAALIVSTEMYK